MDGLLIDSEDKYTTITNEVLRMYGKPELPWSIKAQLQGRPQPEVHQLFFSATNYEGSMVTMSLGQQDLPRVGQTPHHTRGDRRQTGCFERKVLSAI